MRTNNMFSLFAKHCPICGMDVKKENDMKRFGKYCCSEEHAQQYAEQKQDEYKKMEEEKRKHPRRGGCC